MRAERVYRQNLQMAHFVTNRCHIPIWVKHGINAWMTAAGIEDGRLLRSVSKSGKVNRDTLSDWAVWSVLVSTGQ
jgi:hypothetical protein